MATIQFQTRTAEQIATEEAEREKMAFFVKAGDYDFRVVEASNDSSTAGNDMIKIKSRVVLPDGSDGPSYFDYLVFTPKAFYKVEDFLKSCGKHPGGGESIALDTDEMIGWTGRAKLKVEEYNGNKNNKVAAYLFDDFN